jgi:hypothetical protein
MKRVSASDEWEIGLLQVQSNPTHCKAALHDTHGWASCLCIVVVN